MACYLGEEFFFRGVQWRIVLPTWQVYADPMPQATCSLVLQPNLLMAVSKQIAAKSLLDGHKKL